MAFIHIPKLRKAKTRTNLIAIIYLFSEAIIIKCITNKINFIFYLLFNGFRLNLSNVPLVANLHEHENEDWFASEKGWILCIANIISLKVKSLFYAYAFWRTIANCVYTKSFVAEISKRNVRHWRCEQAIQQMENQFCTWRFTSTKGRGDDFSFGESRGDSTLADPTSAWQYLKRRGRGSRERFPSALQRVTHKILPAFNGSLCSLFDKKED